MAEHSPPSLSLAAVPSLPHQGRTGRSLRNDESVFTSTTSSNRSQQTSGQGPRSQRRMPIYVRIVQKDIWLRFHVSLNSTVGSIKDLALQKVNAPHFDPTQSCSFYQDAVNLSAAVKTGAASSQQHFSRHGSDALPKSFVAPCPNPAMSIHQMHARPFEVTSASANPASPPALGSKTPIAWKTRSGLNGHLRGPGATDSDAAVPKRNRIARTMTPSSSDNERPRGKPPLHDVPEYDQALSVSALPSASPTAAERSSTHGIASVQCSSPLGREPPASNSATQPLDLQDTFEAGSPLATLSNQLPLAPFAGGNAEAKEEEARALARLSSWSRSVSAADLPNTGRFDSPKAASSSSKEVDLRNASGCDAFTDDASTSDDDLANLSVPEADPRRVRSCEQAAQSSQSLADTLSSNSSVDMLTTNGADGLWGTQLEDKLLLERRESLQVANLSRPVTSPGDRSRSKTVTAADVGRSPTFDISAAGGAAASHQTLVSLSSKVAVPSANSPLSQRGFAAIDDLPVRSRTQPLSNSAQSSPAHGSSSTWLDRGRLAGIHIDEMSQWREAAHGSSTQFSLYSFSNGLLLEDWKTVAAYRLRPFELLEMQSSSPVERVHLDHGVSSAMKDASRHGLACLPPGCAVLEPYFEGWIFVLKPSSTSTRHTKTSIGTWKLRWITIRGWKIDVFRRKPKASEGSAPVGTYSWHLSLVKWVLSEKLERGPTNPALLSLQHIYPHSITLAFSAAAWPAVTPSEFTLPTSGSSITFRCVTKYDHEALYNVLNRAHFRSLAGTKPSECSAMVVEWRSAAVIRGLIAGRGGTVQPGKLSRAKGRNAIARTRLRPTGWPSDWEDADRWSSSSEVEEMLSSELGRQGEIGVDAASETAGDLGDARRPEARTGRRSLDADGPARGLRAASLLQSNGTVKRSSSPSHGNSLPSTLGRKSNLGHPTDATLLNEKPTIRTNVGAGVSDPPTAEQVSPHRARGFSLSRSVRTKHAERDGLAIFSSSRRLLRSGESTTATAMEVPSPHTQTSSPSMAPCDFHPGSSGRSRAHTFSSSASPSPGTAPPPSGSMHPVPSSSPRRSESRPSIDLKQSTASARRASHAGSQQPPTQRQDVPPSFFPAPLGSPISIEPVPKSVALLKRFKNKSAAAATRKDWEGSGSNSPAAE